MTAFRYLIVAAVVGFAVWRRTRRSRKSGPSDRAGRSPQRRLPLPEGAVWLIAEREVRQRLRSRVFRVGTAVSLAAVAAAIVIPVLHKGQHKHANVGVIGVLSAHQQTTIQAAGVVAGGSVVFVPEPNLAAAEAALRAGHLTLAIDNAQRIVVKTGFTNTDTSGTALFARTVAIQLGLQNGLEHAGLSPAQAAQFVHPTPLPITSLQPPKGSQTTRLTAVYGEIIMYVLLTQYGTWILMGVVEEKSSRVVEVLLSTVRAGELLAGKVIGIGGVALGQGLLLVGVSLGLAAAVGSPLVKGTAPVEVAAILVGLALGYAFYCWVYAAAGSLADRQEHVQALAFPLQLPLLASYLISLTALGSSNPPLLVRVMAYLPLSAPFAMSVLVADNKVSWVGFSASAVLSIAATVGVARFAALVYRRAILQTGTRVRLRRLLTPQAD